MCGSASRVNGNCACQWEMAHFDRYMQNRHPQPMAKKHKTEHGARFETVPITQESEESCKPLSASEAVLYGRTNVFSD